LGFSFQIYFYLQISGEMAKSQNFNQVCCSCIEEAATMHSGLRHLVILGAACSGANAFVAPSIPTGTLAPQHHATARPLRRSAAASLNMADKTLDKRAERRRIVSGKNFNRRGFADTKEEVAGKMGGEFGSDLVAEFKANNGVLDRSGLTVKLAEYYGFCWGAERAVAMAMEARSFHQHDTIHITNEILHNPEVNSKLQALGIKFVPQEGGKTGAKDWSTINSGDVVILPAFGMYLERVSCMD